jgi:hypothetical protein
VASARRARGGRRSTLPRVSPELRTATTGRAASRWRATVGTSARR